MEVEVEVRAYRGGGGSGGLGGTPPGRGAEREETKPELAVAQQKPCDGRVGERKREELKYGLKAHQGICLLGL
jgi:hypothetical protein